MLTAAFGELAMSRTQVQLWYDRFKESREDVNEYAHTGRPSTSVTDENIEAVKNMILDDGLDVGISIGLCQAIFSDVLGMKRMTAKFVPKLINF